MRSRFVVAPFVLAAPAAGDPARGAVPGARHRAGRCRVRVNDEPILRSDRGLRRWFVPGFPPPLRATFRPA